MAFDWPKRPGTGAQADITSELGYSPAPSDQLFLPSEIYHENSKLHVSNRQLYDWIGHVNSSPDVRAVISNPTGKFRGCLTVELPRDFAPSERSFEEILEKRRSGRDFASQPITQEALSKLLYLGDGIVHSWDTPDGFVWKLRTAPSGGGLYPIETYCVVLKVKGMVPGLYFYRANDHCLDLVLEGDFTEALVEAVPGQGESIRGASVCFVLSAVMQRIKFKYGERAYRFILLEAGHIAQNLLLAAEADGLGAVAIGGFMDDPMNELLRVDGVEEAVVYTVLVGVNQTKPQANK